jgi:hypothetical protein
MRLYRSEDRTMIQSYRDHSKYFPKLNIDKLKTIAQRWVDDNTNTPINSIVLYNSSPRRQKYSGEINIKYAVVFEFLKEYEHRNYGMTFQELDDYHKAKARGEIITPDPMDEFYDREENAPDPIDDFTHNTEYYETTKIEKPFRSFMTKDFEDVYWETPKFEFKEEWELIPRLFAYDAEKNEGVLMELPDNVRTREHEILFQVQTDDSIFNYIKKYKLRFFPTPIERDEDIERATWERHIEPIVENYNLKNSLGEKFEYKFFTHPKTITETEMYLMLRKTMDLCQEFSQDPKDEDRDNFLEKVMGKLKSDISKVRGKDGKKVDLKDMFHTFLVGLFKKTKMRGSREYFHELPVFLALVDWEYAKNNVNKDTGKTDDVQREAPEQNHDVFIKEGDDIALNIFRQTGPTWELTYQGKPLKGLKGKGFKYIHFLVKNIEAEYHTNQLAEEVEGICPDSLVGTSDHKYNDKKADKNHVDHRDMVYGKSKKELQKSWKDLKKELKKAEENNDPGRTEKARKELEGFEEYYYELMRPDGKSRKFIDPTLQTKNRIAKSIDRALKKIKEYNETIYNHFHNALKPVHSEYLSYTPDQNIDWLTQ